MYIGTQAQMASALVVAGCGSGSNLAELDLWRSTQREKSAQLLKEGWQNVAEETGHSPTRIQLKKKDPRAWNEFMMHLREHSAKGSALTQRWYQGERDPVYRWEAELKRMTVPTLVAVGTRDAIAGDPHKLAAMMPQAEALDIPGRDHNLAVGDRAHKEGVLAFLGRRA